MKPEEFNVGMAGWGVYLPEKRITAEELSPLVNIPPEVIKTKLGFDQKPLGSSDDHCVTMGIKAARQCLDKTGTDPKEIDLSPHSQQMQISKRISQSNRPVSCGCSLFLWRRK